MKKFFMLFLLVAMALPLNSWGATCSIPDKDVTITPPLSDQLEVQFTENEIIGYLPNHDIFNGVGTKGDEIQLHLEKDFKEKVLDRFKNYQKVSEDCFEGEVTIRYEFTRDDTLILPAGTIMEKTVIVKGKLTLNNLDSDKPVIVYRPQPGQTVSAQGFIVRKIIITADAAGLIPETRYLSGEAEVEIPPTPGTNSETMEIDGVVFPQPEVIGISDENGNFICTEGYSLVNVGDFNTCIPNAQAEIIETEAEKPGGNGEIEVLETETPNEFGTPGEATSTDEVFNQVEEADLPSDDLDSLELGLSGAGCQLNTVTSGGGFWMLAFLLLPLVRFKFSLSR